MVIYGCSSCDLCFLIHTNTCAMKSSENVTSFGIKRDCNLLDLDKVSLKLASKNLVSSKSKPVSKYFLFYLKKKRIFIWIAASGKYMKSKKCSLLASCNI